MQVFSFTKANFFSHLSPSTASTSSTTSNLHLHGKALRFPHKTRSRSSPSSPPPSEEVKPDQKETGEAVPPMLTVRRPMMDVDEEEEAIRSLTESLRREGQSDDADLKYSSKIDKRMSEFAKKLPIFEPKRVENGPPTDRPLKINLELALFRAKILTQNFQFDQAQELLLECMVYWPEDGRIYVGLGKVFMKQSKYAEARAVYERGCQSTLGENAYIWQCWAVLESNEGNIKKARELFDASIVANKKHSAAWHGWAMMELKEGNISKARNLLTKGIRFGGGNEYIYQSLALLEVRSGRIEQARFLFKQALKCNPKSCASWLAWAQLEIDEENDWKARQLFEKAVQASPKNRFAWHMWGLFEANQGDIEKARKLLKIGHTLNPRDPVILQSFALLEYKYTSPDAARALFRRVSKIDPRHQPTWMAWGWMEWREGNVTTARELYKAVLSIDKTTDTAAKCFQAWGVLEERMGNINIATRLFKSSLNVNSQSYITWMTWAKLVESQGNYSRAEEIRNRYLQERTEIVEDPLWVMGFLDIIDPAMDSIKRILNIDQQPDESKSKEEEIFDSGSSETEKYNFDLDAFLRRKLNFDSSRLDEFFEKGSQPRKSGSQNKIWTRDDNNTRPVPP